MDPIQPIAPQISPLPAVEPVRKHVDPDQQRREQERRDRERRKQQRPDEPEEDDGQPHIDISV